MTIISGAEFLLEDFFQYFIQLWLTCSHQSFVFRDIFIVPLLSVSISGLCGPIVQEMIICVSIGLPFIKLKSMSKLSWSSLADISIEVTAVCAFLRRREKVKYKYGKGDFFARTTSSERTQDIRFMDIRTNIYTVALKIDRIAVEENTTVKGLEFCVD